MSSAWAYIYATSSQIQCNLSNASTNLATVESSSNRIGDLIKISDIGINCTTDKLSDISEVGWCALIDGGRSNVNPGYRNFSLQGSSEHNKENTLPLYLYNDHNKSQLLNPIGFPEEASSLSGGGEVWDFDRFGKSFTIPLYTRVRTVGGYHVQNGTYVASFPVQFRYGS